jgi:hypothetical protein
MNGWIRIRIKMKSWIRIRIKMMRIRNPKKNINEYDIRLLWNYSLISRWRWTVRRTYFFIFISSRMYWGTWVVLPEPVEPVKMETYESQVQNKKSTVARNSDSHMFVFV